MPVFCASTPSDHRALANCLAQLRCALPPEPVEPKPERPRRKPKPRPKPKPRRDQVETAIDWQAPAPHGVGGSAPRRRPLPGAPVLRMSRWP